ncbi:MAG: hypothetical protein JL50_09965 [Peptococcaceae bacterium BICA1-7]|nr:MAG: hypothetical protein JL50_09965 [Peptococcaceae bacterium BICA1-7]HBV95607.1 DUF4405 domain-containing protein [Desulfotomaculum sp.]
MNRNKNLFLDMLILLQFAAVVFSAVAAHLFEGENGFRGLTGDVWVWAHAGAGLAMLLCLAVHLAWHRNSIRAKLIRAVSPKPGQCRKVSLEMGLAVVFLLMAVSGVYIWCRPDHGWRHLHGAGAFAMLVLVLRHLARQRRSIMSAVRKN